MFSNENPEILYHENKIVRNGACLVYLLRVTNPVHRRNKFYALYTVATVNDYDDFIVDETKIIHANSDAQAIRLAIAAYDTLDRKHEEAVEEYKNRPEEEDDTPF